MDFNKQIVAFYDGSDLKLVYSEEEAKNKLSVRSERGRQFRIPVKTVVGILGASDFDSFVAKCDSLMTKIEESVADMDTTLLWEMLYEEVKDYSIEELAEFYGDSEPIPSLSLFTALVRDAVHFKRKGVTFSPRTEEQVEEQLQIIRKKQEKEAFKERIVPWLQEALQQPSVDVIPDDFKPFLNLLEVFLANRKDNEASRTFATVIGDRSLKEAVYGLAHQNVELSMKTVTAF